MIIVGGPIIDVWDTTRSFQLHSIAVHPPIKISNDVQTNGVHNTTGILLHSWERLGFLLSLHIHYCYNIFLCHQDFGREY